MSEHRPAIQLFVPKFRVDECLEAIRPALERGWTGMGYLTAEFEDAWKEYSGFDNAHFVNSNTAGLHLAIEVLKSTHGWSDGDEIISTPLTFVSSNHAILYAGLTPVFADVDDQLCMDPDSLVERITDRTRAVMFVGLGGNVGRYADVVRICRERGLAVILDAAHMAGTKVDGRQVGADADVTIFSFQAVKNLPTADSGMVCFAQPEDDAMARRLSWLGISKDTYARTLDGGVYKWMYEVDELGFKYNGNSVMAALGGVALKYLDQDNAERRRLSALYAAALENAPAVRVVPISPTCESSRHLFQVEVDNRDDVIVALNERQIFPGVHYRTNDEYGLYKAIAGHTPRATAASKSLLSLPLHLSLTDDDASYVSEALLAVTG